MNTIMTNFKVEKPRSNSEHIHIGKGKASISITALKFIDKDTKQHVIYLPSFDISGYGETPEKATEMAKFSLIDFFEYLFTLPKDKLQIELAKFGWKRSMFQKDFSKAYIDGNGELQNLNAEDNKVERVTLTAA